MSDTSAAWPSAPRRAQPRRRSGSRSRRHAPLPRRSPRPRRCRRWRRTTLPSDRVSAWTEMNRAASESRATPDAIAEGHEPVVVAGHDDAVTVPHRKLRRQGGREQQDDVLLDRARDPAGARVDAAMAGIDHHHRAADPRASERQGDGRRRSEASGRRAAAWKAARSVGANSTVRRDASPPAMLATSARRSAAGPAEVHDDAGAAGREQAEAEGADQADTLPSPAGPPPDRPEN